MTKTKVVLHRKGSRWKEPIKGAIGAIFIAIAVGVGMLAIIQSVEQVIKYFTK